MCNGKTDRDGKLHERLENRHVRTISHVLAHTECPANHDVYFNSKYNCEQNRNFTFDGFSDKFGISAFEAEDEIEGEEFRHSTNIPITRERAADNKFFD